MVTADHETGGFVLGKGPYELNLQVLKNQKVSESGFTKVINQLRSKTNNQVSWEAVQQALKDNFGFWDKIKLNEKQEARLKTVYEQTLKNQQVKMEKSEYAQDEPIAAEAKLAGQVEDTLQDMYLSLPLEPEPKNSRTELTIPRFR